jgi:leader peptidase (prepilin peptidase)/N-methyltransferase
MWILSQLPGIVTYAFAAAFGAVVGSFLNVVIHRLPRDQSIVRPRSRCPGCGEAILWYDNVPVLSWILLRARCRNCRTWISVRYPLVEAANASLWVLSLWWFGPTLEAAAAAVFLSAMLALAAIDLEHYILPDRITLPGIVVGLALSPYLAWTTPLGSLIGAAAGVCVLLFIMGAYYLIRGTAGMGWGDVKMLAMVGAFLGWKGTAVTLVVGTVVGAAVGLGLVAAGWAGERAVEEGEGTGLGLALPFGVFLALGAGAALFVAPRVVDLYLGLSGLGGAY